MVAKVGEHESHDERKQEVKAGRQQGPTLITVCLSGGGTRERWRRSCWWGMNVGRTSV